MILDIFQMQQGLSSLNIVKPDKIVLADSFRDIGWLCEADGALARLTPVLIQAAGW